MSLHPVLPVLDDLARVIGGMAPEHDTAPTPCEGLDVIGLRRHLLGGIGYFTVVLADPADDRRGRPDPRAYVGPDEPEVLRTAIELLSGAVRAALADGVETVSVKVPDLGGTFPGDHVLSMLLAEAVVHGWDAARATGQSWQPDPAASEVAHALLAQQIKPEYRGGEGMPFAAEVPVHASAPALDRLLGFAGRSPDWRRPAVEQG
ncbi:TIGR03086 family metal-binding protein [Streptomyces kunmingensis]|uniref:TIGR03086 family metal-binding protein n=1 Tax=Streptomyces kunmingensis TaxID=68225 RepID=A0ABU6CKX9_9ACTN|nr:TIGR03086 family metal-binding protein [Streptomyces kunmingensis]MEB3965089.1 TIGR03086 family metal-binding protein [Streptomyces kunmingensis]